MAKKKKGELPSGNIRRQIYDHSEPLFDSDGNPIINPKTGKQKMKRVYISITESSTREAEKVKVEIKAGIKKVSKPTDLTVYDAIDEYIKMSDALLSPSTIRGYRIIQRNAFKSIINLKLSDITSTVLREAVNLECKRKRKYGGKQLTSKTVINEYGLISAVIKTYMPNIDTSSVKLPQIEHNQHTLSTPDVIYNIVKGSSIELPVLLAMWLSFSESEILGLTKSKSISPDGLFITVKDVIIKDEHEKIVIKNKGKQPKRDRTLRIPDYIRTLIEQLETDRLVTITGTALSKRFSRLIDKAGIPHMTFHDLRHVNASVMALLHVPDKYAQERGGWHSDHIMKSTYMQTFSSERAIIDKQIDEFMSEIMFSDESSRNKEKKYNYWLLLFEKEDNEKSMALFDDFCVKNDIVF